MIVNPDFAEALFYISLIMVSPLFFYLSRILSRYLLNRYVSTGKIIVVLKRDGVVVEVKTIKTSAYVVDQLTSADGVSNG